MDKPRLRPIEIIQTQDNSGQKILILRDQFGFTDKMLICPVNPVIILILHLIDGTRTLEDIQKELLNRTGEVIFTDIINQFINQLSEVYFLEDEKFRGYLNKVIVDFINSPTRAVSHVKILNPDDKLAFTAEMKRYFTDEKGPGEINPDKKSNQISAVISPHIDFHRGGNCFAYSYKELAESAPADIYLILGIAHISGQNKYIGTLKDFETPFGTAETDKEFMELINQDYSGNLYEDEFIHKNEHSIEFQTIFLKYIFKDSEHKFKIAPILCCSFHESVLENEQPDEYPEIKSFIQAVQNAAAKTNKKICIISGVDLSHTGQRFGDELEMNDEYLNNLEKEDMEMLKTICSMDKSAFFHSIEKDKDKRKVCGFPSIYTTMAILNGSSEGKLLKYDKSVDYGNQSCVSFASVSFHKI